VPPPSDSSLHFPAASKKPGLGAGAGRTVSRLGAELGGGIARGWRRLTSSKGQRPNAVADVPVVAADAAARVQVVPQAFGPRGNASLASPSLAPRLPKAPPAFPDGRKAGVAFGAPPSKPSSKGLPAPTAVPNFGPLPPGGPAITRPTVVFPTRPSGGGKPPDSPDRRGPNMGPAVPRFSMDAAATAAVPRFNIDSAAGGPTVRDETAAAGTGARKASSVSTGSFPVPPKPPKFNDPFGKPAGVDTPDAASQGRVGSRAAGGFAMGRPAFAKLSEQPSGAALAPTGDVAGRFSNSGPKPAAVPKIDPARSSVKEEPTLPGYVPSRK